MKKIVGLIIAVLLVIGAGVFWYQSKINEAITSKINELNSNGFAVKNEQSTNYIKTRCFLVGSLNMNLREILPL
jgi:uncharacterized protein YxeA